MNLAVLGNGKTGSKVVEILINEKIPHTIYDSKNILDKNKITKHDAVISFLPEIPFKSYIELLIEAKIPVVTGATGITYTDEFKKTLTEKKLTWIYANNFSLGMNLVSEMIKIMQKADLLVKNPTFTIHEIHHTKKLDAPSGTALSFKYWLNRDVEITSERTGDVIGIHELKLKTNTEEITLRHEALDRKIFAEGAIWAAKKILTDKSIPHGLNLFQDIVSKTLHQGNGHE
jgi:4-hydroxy-tetrahydrodipicolinate reductase